MCEEIKECLAFLCLFGTVDREKLLGKRLMRFCDFERFLYLAELLKLPLAEQALWKRHAALFAETFRELEALSREEEGLAVLEDEIQSRERWKQEFVRGCPVPVEELGPDVAKELTDCMGEEWEGWS